MTPDDGGRELTTGGGSGSAGGGGAEPREAGDGEGDHGRGGEGGPAGEPPRRPTHLDEEGRPRMVDVSDKEDTRRRAVAEGLIRMAPETLEAIREGRTPKGEVLTVAEVAGVSGGKRTAELVPFCHPLPLTHLDVELSPDPELPGIRARAEARVTGPTGVEMEALTAVATALLTVYDMAKALDRGMRIEGIRLLSKEGGRSGVSSLPPESGPGPRDG